MGYWDKESSGASVLTHVDDAFVPQGSRARYRDPLSRIATNGYTNTRECQFHSSPFTFVDKTGIATDVFSALHILQEVKLRYY